MLGLLSLESKEKVSISLKLICKITKHQSVSQNPQFFDEFCATCAHMAPLGVYYIYGLCMHTFALAILEFLVNVELFVSLQ